MTLCGNNSWRFCRNQSHRPKTALVPKPRTPNLHLRPDKIAVSTLPETILNQPAGISWSSRTGSFHPPHRKSPGLKITLLLLLAPTIMARVMGWVVSPKIQVFGDKVFKKAIKCRVFVRVGTNPVWLVFLQGKIRRQPRTQDHVKMKTAIYKLRREASEEINPGPPWCSSFQNKISVV